MASLKENSTRNLLLLAGFLAMFAESILSPFYPLFFREVFNSSNIVTTGFYISLCRVVVIVFAIIWGLLAKKYNGLYIVMFGQFFGAVFSLVCTQSLSVHQFFIFSLLMVAFKSSYVLLYPLLIKYTTKSSKAQSVALTYGLMSSALLLSAFVGSFLIKIAKPLYIFYFIAIFDIIQLLICYYISRKELNASTQKLVSQATSKINLKQIYIAAFIVIFCVYAVVNIMRPFLIEYLTQSPALKMNMALATFYYVLPLLIMVGFAYRINNLNTNRQFQQQFQIWMFCFLLAIVLHLIPNHIALIVGRVLFGLATLYTAAIIDLFIFNNSDEASYETNYSYIVALQSLAILVGPLVASYLIEQFSLIHQFLICIPLVGVAIAAYYLGIQPILKQNPTSTSSRNKIEQHDNEYAYS